MASLSRNLSQVNDSNLQKILVAMFADLVAATPAAAVAIAAPVGGVGAAAGGWDTAGNRDLAITTINALVTDVAALRATVALLTKTTA